MNRTWLHRKCGLSGAVALAAALCAGTAAAHAQSSRHSLAVDHGKLAWSVAETHGQCGYDSQNSSPLTYREWSFTNFSFVSGGKTYPLVGADYYYQSSGQTGCPKGPTPSVLRLSLPASRGSGVIDFTSEANGDGMARLAPNASSPAKAAASPTPQSPHSGSAE